MTTIVTPEQLPQLLAMAQQLNITLTQEQVEQPQPQLQEQGPLESAVQTEGEVVDLEAARKGLDDLFNLY